MSIGKIVLILMMGVQETQIRDETPTNDALGVTYNRNYLTVTLYEDTTNVLHIQLDCAQQYRVDSVEFDCSRAHHVDVWIDLNGDGEFDDTENRVRHRSSINNQLSRSTNDLQISIPEIDDTNTKSGSHRMRIKLTPSEDYRLKCGNTDYSETREYTVNIIPRIAYAGKICSLRFMS
jgi:hypothetical protein